MKQDAAVKAIYQRWMTLWPGLSGSTSYVFDNDAIDQPPSYARVSISMLDEQQHTLGNSGARKFLETGLIDVKLYSPANAGRGPSDAMVDLVRQVFQSVRFGATGTEEGVVTFATTDRKLPREAGTQYWIVVASTAFEFFDVR